MLKNSYKTKRFLGPILSLVLFSILSIASINAYLTINMFKTHMQSDIVDAKKEYLKQNKDEIYTNAHRIDNAIKYQITTIENKLKESLKEKVQTALNIAQFIYDTDKNNLNKEELKQKIAHYLSAIKFNENRGYYFMYDDKTKILFGHPMKKFIGRDMTNFKDLRNQNLMKLDEQALKNNKIGYSKIYFSKPNEQDKEFPKITCISRFEPLNIIIGTGEYLDVVESQIKKDLINRLLNIQENGNKHLILMDLHKINGGDDFATLLLNYIKPDEEGKKVSDSYQDINGKEFRKEYLQVIREKGEGYIKFWYKNPDNKETKPKMQYFYLQKDWNWIISNGFYFDDLEKQIVEIEESLIAYTNKTIYKTFLIVALLSLVLIIVAILISIKIDKTIKNYTNEIIEYKNEAIVREQLIMQQSKMAIMGEMMESIAHQWKQPLSVISMLAVNTQLDIELDAVKNDELSKNIIDITNQTQHLSQTIDDFRSFFKEEKVKKVFNIKNVFDKTINLLVSKFKNNNIKIIMNIDDIQINGFSNELVQVFMNILNNAIDELVLQDTQRMIFVDIHKINEEVIIKIKDNAGGIPKEVLPKLFESHFTTKQERDGTGIGLHMTEKIIKNSFIGTIEAKNVEYEYDSSKYIGAEFVIIFAI
jgi:two-component system NtrC family sensor kinase